MRPDRFPEAPTRPMTFEEYLAFELRSEERHEFVRGHVFAMSGAMYRHHHIVSNIQTALHAVARGGPCEVFRESFKLRVGDDVYYPDVMVACRHDLAPRDLWLTAPCLLVEVLSPDSGRTDRVEKRDAYTRLPSLRAYLVVHTTHRHVERHWRDAAGVWHEDWVGGPAGEVPVPCPTPATLSLDTIYEGSEVPPTPLRRLKEEPAGEW